MKLALSYAALCLLQAALVAAPLEAPRRRRIALVGLLVPVLALALGVGLLRGLSASPRALAILACVATPLLAACMGWVLRWRSPWLALVLSGALFFLAWQTSSLAGQGASVILIALACLTIAAAVALVAPPGSIAAGLVVLAIVDCILVWGTPQVGPASDVLADATLPTLAIPGLPHRHLPALQQATFGTASMGWLDVLAPALLCTVVVRAQRTRAAIATGTAAALWGLLLVFTSPIPATVPVLAGLGVAYTRPRFARLERLRPQRRATYAGGMFWLTWKKLSGS
jgi:hypothetical protein